MTSLFSITTELLTHKSEAQFRVAPCEQSRKGRTLTGADFGSFDTQTFLASDYNVVGRVFQYKNCSKAETNIFSPVLLLFSLSDKYPYMCPRAADKSYYNAQNCQGSSSPQ